MRFLGYVARSESQTNYGLFQYNFIFLLTESSPITLSGISGIEYESVELGFFLYSENLQIAPMHSTVSFSSSLAELNGKATTCNSCTDDKCCFVP